MLLFLISRINIEIYIKNTSCSRLAIGNSVRQVEALNLDSSKTNNKYDTIATTQSSDSLSRVKDATILVKARSLGSRKSPLTQQRS